MTPFDEKGKYVRIPTDLRPKQDGIGLGSLAKKRVFWIAVLAIAASIIFIYN